MDEHVELVSGRELAEMLGFAPSYISKLKTQGVLVRCLVEPSKRKKINPAIAIKEIEASKDPRKEYVRQRWEDYRHGGDMKPVVLGVGTDANVISFQDAKTRKEIMLAKKAELDYEEAAGKLVDKRQVQKTATGIAVLTRESLNTIPDRLSQVLAAETGPDKIHEQLTEEINKVLHAVADRLERDLDVRSQA